jgi:phosphatidylserine/phosphatidylglycerophosphate/cardiolipin synthase-like enzyme
LVRRLEHAWKSTPISPGEVASALRGAAAAAMLRSSLGVTELVWTGPSTGFVPVRYTEQVLCELIDFAKDNLFIVSFVAYEIDTIIKALQNAVDRNVHVSVLLESSTEHGGKLSYDPIATLKKALPTIAFYALTAESKAVQGKFSGSVHAKCAVADGGQAFITSANLTSAAMDKNMELGVLIKGGDLPVSLQRHLEALIATRVIEKVQVTDG